MPVATPAAKKEKIVPAAPETSAAPRTKRIRLSKAFSAARLKPKKVKLLSRHYTMTESEYAQLSALKKHLLALGVNAKKGDLLRAGLALLLPLTDAALKEAVTNVQLTQVAGSEVVD